MNKTRALAIIIFLIIVLTAGPSFAQDFTVRSLGDYGNVSVMETSGNYDVRNSDGTSNIAPRLLISKEFLKTHKDEYDFLVILSNFDFQMSDADVVATYHGVRNDIQGIGQDIFDNSPLAGSNGMLQGIIDMGNITPIAENKVGPESFVTTLSHELMHRWGAYVKFRTPDGGDSSLLLGIEQSHWSFLLDSGGSVMYGNRWQDNGNGTFTSSTPQKEMKLYSPLDLYLAGMIDKSRVPAMMLISNPSIEPERLPAAGITISGTPTYVTIDDIIAANGPRIPDTTHSPKSFKTGFIYITNPGTFSTDAIYAIENIRNGFVTRHSILTDGQSIVQVASTSKDDLPTNPGVLPPSTTPRTLPPNIEDGVTWLMNNQKGDGSWMDDVLTLERDTAEAIHVLKNFPIAQQNYQSGLARFAELVTDNADYLAKKIETLAGSGQDVLMLAQDLVAQQNADGGWGKGRNYWSNATDTSLALKALSSAGYSNMQVISKAIGYLKAQQNPDGCWGSEDKGGMVQETSHVLSAFNKYRTAYQLDDAISRGTTWLIGRQNPDGGFGNSPSTVYDTATAVLVLRELNASTEITNNGLDYIRGKQGGDGSWNRTDDAKGKRAGKPRGL